MERNGMEKEGYEAVVLSDTVKGRVCRAYPSYRVPALAEIS